MLEPQVVSATKNSLYNRFLHTLFLALGYALFGILTILSSFAEGYSVPFWPAAGLGLAGLLIWGRYCWPGIWVGSLLVDLWIEQSIGVLPSSFLVSSAASLQAVVAATLLKPLFSSHQPVAKDSDLLRFLLLAGPVACLISPSVGVINQYQVGLLAVQDIRTEWLIWWAGDTLGVLLFTPILLLIWQDRHHSWPQVATYRIILPLVITALLLLLGNFALARLEKGRSLLELERQLEEISDLRFETLPDLIRPLTGLERFMSSSVEVGSEEFASYTRFITDEDAVLAVYWAPLAVTVDRQESFQSLFSEPQTSSFATMEFNHLSDLSQVEAMRQAQASGLPVMASVLPLPSTGKLGVLVFQAVYQNSQHPLYMDVASEEYPLSGFLVALYDLQIWLQSLVQASVDDGIYLRLTDVSQPSVASVLLDTLPDGIDPIWVKDLEIASRTWRLEMQSIKPFWKPGSTVEEQLYLVFSVMAAFMAVFATLGSAGRFAATNAVVTQRTHELREELKQRQLTELALLESEGRYRSLIEKAPFIILVQQEGRIVYLNPQGIRAFAADSLEQVVGYSIIALVHKDYRTIISDRMESISAGKAVPNSVVMTCLRLNGTSFVADWSLVPYEIEGGSGSLVVLQDITARQEAEELLDRFFTVSLDLLCIADTKGNFIRVNPAFTHILGWSESELLSQPFFNLIHPDDRQSTELEVLRIIRGAHASEFKNRYLCHNGSWRWLEWKALPQPNGLIYASAHDVTLQHDATEQLHQLNDKLRIRIEERGEALRALNAKEQEIEAVLNHLIECVITIDDVGVIHRVNPAATTIFGYAAGEMLGHNISMLMSESFRSEHDEYLKAYKQTGIARLVGSSREVEGRCKNGASISLELAVSRYEIHGQIYFTGTLRDISERRSLIFQLINARVEAEEASHAKSAFLATMSHEIRTPMNGVLGLIEVLDQDEMSDYQQGLVHTIQRSARSLLRIIDDILDFSKIEAGRLEINLETTDLGELVEDLSSSLVVLALDKHVDLSVFISPELPVQMDLDPGRIRQVLYNLLGNAIKFSGGREQRGKVAVRVLLDSDDSISIVIQDNGIGIQAERLSELFDPFIQAETNTTRRFGGTGLGLAISKRLVDMMEGEIRVESQLHQGSTFTLLLPMHKPIFCKDLNGPDLRGLSCVILPADAYLPEDIAVYGISAGAHMLVYSKEDSLVHLLSCLSPPVVLITDEKPPIAELAGLLASMPHLRHLQIQQGRRRRARIDDPTQVLLDGDALSRKTLLQALSISAGFASPSIATYRQLDGEKDLLSVKLNKQAQTSDQLILVAEDDDINQIVILQQLRLLGYSAEIANNGKQALELWRTGRFSLLFTDLHMPEMDGYELTTNIRNEEAQGQRFPILALTANALRGESDRATLVGMDTYLIKPVKLTKLQAALEAWLPKQAIQDSLPLLDLSVLSELVGGDELVMNELLVEYMQSARKHTASIFSAWQAHDPNQIAGVAHMLKSSSRSVGAMRLGEICSELEAVVTSGDSADIEANVPIFNDLVTTTLHTIEQHLGIIEKSL